MEELGFGGTRVPEYQVVGLRLRTEAQFPLTSDF
jgi:hypothetical protein